MGKRHSGLHTRVELPPQPHCLPANIFDLLKDAVDYAAIRAVTVWKMRTQINENTFDEDRERFVTIALENAGLYYLLLAIFFSKIYLDVKRFGPTLKVCKRNMFIAAALSQRELTRAYLHVAENELPFIETWVGAHLETSESKFDKDDWRTNFSGARSVAHAIKLFLHNKALVYFPSAYVDIQNRIDLLVRFPSESVRLCVQIKSKQEHPPAFRLFGDEDPAGGHEEDMFREGVRDFQIRDPGIWIPVEIRMGRSGTEMNPMCPSEEANKIFQTIANLVRDARLTPNTLNTHS